MPAGGSNPDVDPSYVGDFDLVAAPLLVQPAADGEARNGSPFVSPSSLARRPRSNQRTRTPMRYESPLNPDAFRRDRPSPERPEERRITVRPLAGAAIGTTLGRRARQIREVAARRPVTPSSSKQGPSHRKIRRWNNDNFVGISSEIAKASSRGPAVAEALLKAQADAPLYLSVYNPDDHPPSTISRFMDTESGDIGIKGLREDFFRGEIGYPISRTPTNKPDVELTPQIMLNRIHGRLLTVVARACPTSQASVKFVDCIERFLAQCFGKEKVTPLETGVSVSLLEPPAVTRNKSGSTIAQFYFHPVSSAGGFHRLLLHAVTQFHGLNAISKTVEMETNTARLLTVTGSFSGPNVRLLDYIIDDFPSAGTCCPCVSSRDVNRQTSDVSHAAISLSTLRL